jgi:hypothetical protein
VIRLLLIAAVALSADPTAFGAHTRDERIGTTVLTGLRTRGRLAAAYVALGTAR